MAKSARKGDTGANLGFEAKLWQAANKPRSNMDAAEYKHVVLGLIFLKYISDSFCALLPKEDCAFYNYMALLYCQDQLTSQARGSAQQNLSKELVESISTRIPDCFTLKLFHSIIASVFEKAVGNLIENLQLSKLGEQQRYYLCE